MYEKSLIHVIRFMLKFPINNEVLLLHAMLVIVINYQLMIFVNELISRLTILPN